jgi:Fe-S-cluster containining protein
MDNTQPAGISDRMTYFFDSGIKFTCRQCGQCCTGETGTIYTAPVELQPIANFLHLSVQELIGWALYPYKDSYSIKERADGACIFYSGGCSIYPVRPAQCRSFPFWITTMRSAYAWKHTVRACPGIGHGRLYTRGEILAILDWSPV